MLFQDPIYAWWLSVAAVFLNISWSLHNVIAWMKIRPFLSRIPSFLFIGTVILAQPYWVLEIYANFAYFHDINDLFLRTRPWEALCRWVVVISTTLNHLPNGAYSDPWWVITTVLLFYNIKKRYDIRISEIIRISPRFGVMLGSMVLSIIFIIVDILSVTEALQSSLPIGINPFWKLSFVFKCLTDSVVLDDFKTALDRLRAFKMSRMGSIPLDDGDLSVISAGDRQGRRWHARYNSHTVDPMHGLDGDSGAAHHSKPGIRHLESAHIMHTRSVSPRDRRDSPRG